MYERVIATEMKFDSIQMTAEHVLAQKFKESDKWTAQEAYINEPRRMRPEISERPKRSNYA